MDTRGDYAVCEFITFPEGVQNRTQAIQHRIETAGLQRKVGKNQTRAVRVLLTGTHEQMMALANGGRLDDWCRANIKWLHDTFGEDNLVSCVLHMDEKIEKLAAEKEKVEKGAKDGKNRILSWLGTGELPKLEGTDRLPDYRSSSPICRSGTMI